MKFFKMINNLSLSMKKNLFSLALFFIFLNIAFAQTKYSVGVASYSSLSAFQKDPRAPVERALGLSLLRQKSAKVSIELKTLAVFQKVFRTDGDGAILDCTVGIIPPTIPITNVFEYEKKPNSIETSLLFHFHLLQKQKYQRVTLATGVVHRYYNTYRKERDENGFITYEYFHEKIGVNKFGIPLVLRTELDLTKKITIALAAQSQVFFPLDGYRLRSRIYSGVGLNLLYHL
jgi:hypothetical protein